MAPRAQSSVVTLLRASVPPLCCCPLRLTGGQRLRRKQEPRRERMMSLCHSLQFLCFSALAAMRPGEGFRTPPAAVTRIPRSQSRCGGRAAFRRVDGVLCAAGDSSDECDRFKSIASPETELSTEGPTVKRREFLSSAGSAGILAMASQLFLPSRTSAIETRTPPVFSDRINYQQSPVNKRSGVTLADAEKVYPLPFITYLSRILLVFDRDCQLWWYEQAQALPPKATKEEVENIRLEQFGRFAASVEVGLIDFEGKDGEGAKSLIDALIKRFGPASLKKSTKTDKNDETEIRKSKEALRQIALLFSLLKEGQPVDRITKILAFDDDAKIESVFIVDKCTGYPPNFSPLVVFPEPPTLGPEFEGSSASGTAMMKSTGRLLRIDVLDSGSGYTSTPKITINSPGESNGNETIQATARAVLGKKRSKGGIERIEVTQPDTGYALLDDVEVVVSEPEAPGGVSARAEAIFEYEVVGVNITHAGRGYAAEKPIRIDIAPPPEIGDKAKPAAAVAYPRGKSTSYASFVGSEVVSGSSSSVDTSQWVQGPSSSQLLALLPSGFGLQYDEKVKRYQLTSASSTNWETILSGRLQGQSFKPINPIFGFRGRSPIEREKDLDLSKVIRFVASGSICSSLAHFVLTPIDVVKTKIQTKPDQYNQGIVGTFTKVLDEEGAASFFSGWESTTLGYFIAGGIAFYATEYFRRYYGSLVKSAAMALSGPAASEIGAQAFQSNLEIPLIIASAATSAFICCFFIAPFDAVRIRTVSQPDYAPNFFAVSSRMVKEEGLTSLFSAVPVWFLKEIPYNAMKFLVFDVSTEYMYEVVPAAREDIRLSLFVSLLGGVLAGVCATIVSNPADVVVSELKKSKTSMTALQAVDKLRDQFGLPAFARGIELRMIYYSLLVSVQFFLYDAIRISLGVGSDDMRLYLNVLNAALTSTK